MLRVEKLRVHGLPPLTFEVPAGECFAIEGASGSGKSLLLRAIADLDAADGDVFLGEIERREMAAPAWRRRVRYVASEAAWWAETPRQHLADEAQQGPKLQRLLTGLGLETVHLDRSIAVLSTGERQRLALLRALIDDPPVLLLDEPTSGLDPANAALIDEVIKFLLLQKRIVVLVSHDPAQVDRLAHARLLLGKGAAKSTAARVSA